MNQSSNILDIPRQPGAIDQLGVDDYVDALVNFISTADMPTTIAVQGEWGSGKTSLLYQIKHKLCETGLDKAKDLELPYYGIWVNTWQYALLKTKSETIMSILGGLTKEITNTIKSKHESQSEAVLKKVGSIFGKIAKIGTEAALSQIGVEASLDSLASGDDSSAVQLLDFKKSLEDAIAKCLELDKAKGNNNKGFIFFIDDLDRIDPPMAVEILELIKNIFEVDKCIFILAIDYEVVVKGLVPKFGPLTDKNEREFRSFFDKIIQLPFSMPIAMYDVNNFLIGSLEKINYLTADALKDETLIEHLATFASLTVGNNPRSLKRLINNISLLHIINNLKNDNKLENYELVINFALVCVQISYPRIYQSLLEEPDFKSWNERTAKKMQLPEMTEAQTLVIADTSEFDEDWEIVVFRICQKESFLASRAFQVSQLLNLVAELVPEKLEFGAVISSILGTSSITNVNLDFIPKKLSKGDKVRFEGWKAYEKNLIDSKMSDTLIGLLKKMHDFLEEEYKGLVGFNYAPNLLVFVCKFPKGAKKSVAYFHYRKGFIKIEINGIWISIYTIDDFNTEVKTTILDNFNKLSINQK
jgi:hypothetical protein